MSASLPLPLDVLVAVVAHRALLADRLSSYLSLLLENGFTILHQTHLLLTPSHLPLLLNTGVEDDTSLFTPSTPACVLLLQRVDAYPTFALLRDQLDFVYASSCRWTALRDQDAFFPSQPQLERCLLVLQPGYSQEDYATVLEEVEREGFVTIDMTGKILSADEAASLCRDPSAVSQWSSGISVFVAVERMHAQTRLALLLGPNPPELARTLAPSTLRARISSPLYMSPSPEQAAVDMRLAWPQPFPIQRTVALLGGPALSTLPALLAELATQGFTVLHQTTTFLPRSSLTRLFPSPLSPSLSSSLTHWANSDTAALLLTKPAAIPHCQAIISSWGQPGYTYASAAERAEEDIRELFPLVPPAPHAMSAEEVMQRFAAPLPTPTPTATPQSLQSVLTAALIALCKAKPAADDAVAWLANHLLAHNPNTPLVTPPHTNPSITLPSPSSSPSPLPPTFPSSSPSPPSPLKTIWAPYAVSADDPLIAALVARHGFTAVDVPALMAEAVRMEGGGVGVRIGEYVGTGRAVPWGVGGGVVERVVKGGGKGVGEGGEAGLGVGGRRWVLCGFPMGMEQALGYEGSVGEVSAVLVGKKGVGVMDEEGVEEVVDHYRAFGKVIEADSSQMEGKAVAHAVQRMAHAVDV